MTPSSNGRAVRAAVYANRLRPKPTIHVRLPRREACEQIGPADTPDEDYGRLLERAYGKGGTSPTGFDTLWTIVSERRVAAA